MTAAKKEVVENKASEAAHKKGLSFKKVRSVTRTLLKTEFDKPIYVKLQGTIFEAEDTAKRKGGSEMQAPWLVHVIDLETGEECQIIVPEVLKEELNNHYADGAYVGKSFEIIKRKIEGKRYSGFNIAEIEVE